MNHGSKIVDKVFNLIPIQRQDASQDFNFLSNRKKKKKTIVNIFISFNLIKLDKRYEK